MTTPQPSDTPRADQWERRYRKVIGERNREAERAERAEVALSEALQRELNLYATVREQFDRAEQAERQARELPEQIAQAIEAENGSFGVSDDPYGGEYDRGVHQGLLHAARIARERTTTEEPSR